MTTQVRARPSVGRLLRQWRNQRRLSQLELSIQADISPRHLSFVETGRSLPSREMVLRLAEQLDVPLRERNQLLMAAGYAPAYAQSPLDSPELTPVRSAVRQILRAHVPNPAVAVDRLWNIVEANDTVAILTEGSSPRLLAPPVNALRLTLHPDGMAPRIVNLGEWRAHLLGRLGREAALSDDAELRKLHDELRAYPCDQPAPPTATGPGQVAVPLRIRYHDRQLAFLSTVSTFGTPLDITVAELSVESFLPADPDTAAFLRKSAADHDRTG